MQDPSCVARLKFLSDPKCRVTSDVARNLLGIVITQCDAKLALRRQANDQASQGIADQHVILFIHTGLMPGFFGFENSYCRLVGTLREGVVDYRAPVILASDG